MKVKIKYLGCGGFGTIIDCNTPRIFCPFCREQVVYFEENKEVTPMIDFESLGYKNITKDNPIHFSECLGEFFDSVCPYNQRFYKQEGNITIELKVGNYYGMCFISGTCYYLKGWETFELCAPEDYVNEMFIQTLNTVKLKIIENIIKIL